MRLNSKECILDNQTDSVKAEDEILEVSIHVESKYDSLFWMRYKIMVELIKYFKRTPC